MRSAPVRGARRHGEHHRTSRIAWLRAAVPSANDACPWPLTFSFARAIQHPALEIWRGDPARVTAAQDALLHRARCDRAALRGEYDAAMERA